MMHNNQLIVTAVMRTLLHLNEGNNE